MKKTYGQIAFESYSAAALGGFTTPWSDLPATFRDAWGEAARAVVAEMVSDALPRTADDAPAKSEPIKVASRLGLPSTARPGRSASPSPRARIGWRRSCMAGLEESRLCRRGISDRDEVMRLGEVVIIRNCEIAELKLDVERLSIWAERVGRAWEQDPTSITTENAIRELGLCARPVHPRTEPARNEAQFAIEGDSHVRPTSWRAVGPWRADFRMAQSDARQGSETPSVVRNFRCGHCGERVTEHRLVSNCGGCGEEWRAVVTGGDGT